MHTSVINLHKYANYVYMVWTQLHETIDGMERSRESKHKIKQKGSAPLIGYCVRLPASVTDRQKE